MGTSSLELAGRSTGDNLDLPRIPGVGGGEG